MQRADELPDMADVSRLTEFSGFHTPNSLMINVPMETICDELQTWEDRGTDVLSFVSTRVETSYELSRVLRTAGLFLSFFLLGRSWLSLPISIAAFFLGYFYLFVPDILPFSWIVDALGLMYQFLVNLYVVVPLAVVLVAIFTHSYILMVIYLCALVCTSVLRFVFDRIYTRVAKRKTGALFTPIDAKVVRILYHYGSSRREMSFYTFKHRIAAIMPSSISN